MLTAQLQNEPCALGNTTWPRERLRLNDYMADGGKVVTYWDFIENCPVPCKLHTPSTPHSPSLHVTGMHVHAVRPWVARARTQGILLADQAERLDSMNLLRLMAPVALALLLPAIALLEPGAPGAALALAAERPGFVGLLAGNAALAYVVNFTNFQITKYTSALTLQVRCADKTLKTLPPNSKNPKRTA